MSYRSTDYRQSQLDQYQDWMSGAAGKPDSILEITEKSRRDYLLNSPEKNEFTLHDIEFSRVQARAEYYLKLARGGLKPRIIRKHESDSFDISLSRIDAFCFANLSLVLEDGHTLKGQHARSHQDLRKKYHDLFFYSLNEKDADAEFMQ